MSAQSAGLKIGITTDDIWNPIAPLDLAWAEHNLVWVPIATLASRATLQLMPLQNSVNYSQWGTVMNQVRTKKCEN
jgi:hypothetical protein